MHQFRRRFVLRELREGRFWPVLGYRALAWRRFVHQLRRERTQDQAVLRVAVRTRGGIPYHVWLTYRFNVGGRWVGSLRPHRLYLPDDEQPESLYGIPPQLRGLAYFAPEHGVIRASTKADDPVDAS